MVKKTLLTALLGAAGCLASLAAPAATIDIVQAPTGYFVPSDAQKYDWPYYRWYLDDWSWTHNAISGTITSAYLLISAFDVDYDQGERDEIFVYDGTNPIFLGYLAGANDVWNFTLFPLPPTVFDDIGTGLSASIAIDVNDEGWAVTLAKSALCVNPTDPQECVGNPNPGVPEPASLALLGLGLAGLAAARRRRVA